MGYGIVILVENTFCPIQKYLQFERSVELLWSFLNTTTSTYTIANIVFIIIGHYIAC